MSSESGPSGTFHSCSLNGPIQGMSMGRIVVFFLLVWFGGGLVGFETKYEFSDSNPSWVRNEFLFWLPRRPFPVKYTYYLVASHAQNLCIPQVVDSERRRAFSLWATSRSLWWNRDGAEEEKNSRRRRGGLFELEARERELEGWVFLLLKEFVWGWRFCFLLLIEWPTE